MLMLLLVSLQAYAGACSVHCGGMDLAATRDSAPAMTNCRGMSMNHDAQTTKTLLSPVMSCSKPCQADWKLLQSRANNLDAQVLAVSTLFALDTRAPLPAYARSGRFSIDRSTRPISPFDPLISNLRI